MLRHSSKPIGIIILNWNGSALLRKYLPSVVEHTDPDLADVIVADNGSDDDSLTIFAEEFPQVLTIDLGTNHGFAEGYNLAIAQVSHPYVLLLNSDVRVTPGWILPLYRFLQSHPDAVSVQPTLRWDRNPEMLEYSGALGGYMDHLGYPFCRGRIFSTLEKDEGQYGKQPMEVFWTSGAAMMVRRNDFIHAGGLDPSFFAHQEEIDLAWRWQSLGKRLYVIPESIVYHYGGASLDASNPRKTYLNFRNNLRMLYRNLPENRRRRILRIRRILDILAALVFLLSGKTEDAKAVMRAWRDARGERYPAPPMGDKEQAYRKLYPHSLLVRYHLRGERLYSDLKK